MSGQEELSFGEFVPLNWKPADKEHKLYCLEQVWKHAWEQADTKAVISAVQEHNKMMGHHAPKQMELSGEVETKTRGQLEDRLRKAGIDPELIARQVLDQ